MFTSAVVVALLAILVMSGYGTAAIILCIFAVPFFMNGLTKWLKLFTRIDDKLNKKLEGKLLGEEDKD